jgi:glucan 1,3-beta-glucosidase
MHDMKTYPASAPAPRRHGQLLTACLGLLASLLWASVPMAGQQVLPLELGDRATGHLAPSPDVDSFGFDGVASELVGIVARKKGSSDSPLQLELVLLPDGVVLESIQSDTRCVLRRFPLPVTGSYRIDLSSDGLGAYRLKTRTRLPKAGFRLTLTTLPDGTAEVAFPGRTGLLMTARLRDTAGPLAPETTVTLTGPAGPIDLSPFSKAGHGKRKISRLTLEQLGGHLLAIGQAPGPASLEGSVRVKPAKGRRLHREQLQLHGLCVSFFQAGQDPNLGDQANLAQVNGLIQLVKDRTLWFRTFGVDSEALRAVGEIVHELGPDKRHALGIWLGPDQAVNAQQVQLGIDVALAGHADLVIVGSEVLLRNDLSLSQLLAHIATVRAALPAGLPVTTAALDTTYLAQPALVDAVDLAAINVYPFWAGTPLADAVTQLACRVQAVQTISNGKPVWISETGWPSGGDPVGAAVPSPKNAALYFREFVSWAAAKDVPYFYFAARDEAWKTKLEGSLGATWGLWTAADALKPGLAKVFLGDLVNGAWIDNPLPCEPDER